MTVTDHLPGDDDTIRVDPENAYRLYYSGAMHGPAGLVWSHLLDDGRWCSTDIPFRGHGGGRAEWTVVLDNPLTLTPALRCKACRSAGWLDGATWRPTK